MGIIARLKSSMAPAKRPQISRESALKLLGLMPRITEDETVRLIAIRGYYRDSLGKPGVNDRGVYDDAFIVVHFGDRPEFVEDMEIITFNGNTDPSVFRRGIASLMPGNYWFGPGKHKIASPKGYAAFRQMSAVGVARDGGKPEVGHFGINIHAGGWNATYSEGCLTVPPNQWEEFRSTIYSSVGATVERVRANPAGSRDWRFVVLLTTREDCEKLGIAF